MAAYAKGVDRSVGAPQREPPSVLIEHYDEYASLASLTKAMAAERVVTHLAIAEQVVHHKLH